MDLVGAYYDRDDATVQPYSPGYPPPRGALRLVTFPRQLELGLEYSTFPLPAILHHILQKARTLGNKFPWREEGGYAAFVHAPGGGDGGEGGAYIAWGVSAGTRFSLAAFEVSGTQKDPHTCS